MLRALVGFASKLDLRSDGLAARVASPGGYVMRLIPFGPAATRFTVGVAVFTCAFAGAFSSTGQARQARTVAQGVYSGEQAKRGQQVFQAQCAACHGDTLEGIVGPPLTGDAFLGVWNGRPVADLVDKIQQTMPPQAPGTISRPQAIDISAYILQVGKFPAGQAELTAAALPQVTFPAARAAAAPAAGAAAGAPSLAPSANLAQLMRGITFPNANIIFNVQIKDPGNQPKAQPAASPFDYVNWGATVYPGWQAVDQAALALTESTPLFLLPGRRCENGRPAPVDRADYKQYTQALVDVSRLVYKAAQTRNQDMVIEAAERLNDTCANCHKVYRDGTAEGASAGAQRCQ
jgi:mono/diheme cytochrome c family protein